MQAQRKMKNYTEIHREIESLYRSGTICMEQSGTDTQYAPIRHALEYVIGAQETLLRSAKIAPILSITNQERVRFTESELTKILETCLHGGCREVKMAASALEWVLDRKTKEEMYADCSGQNITGMVTYLKLRWKACYYLFVDARFERAHQAFLNKDEQIQSEVRNRLEKQGSAATSTEEFMREYALVLAEEIEALLQVESDSSRAENERDIAETVVTLSMYYN